MAREEARPQTREEAEVRESPRKRRVPLGRQRLRLHVDPSLIPAGTVARWINDQDNRLNEAGDAGYTFIDNPEIAVGEDGMGRDKMTKKVRTRVGISREGTPMYAYLMAIPKDIYDQDQRDKQVDINKTEDAMRRGIDKEGVPGKEGRYIPKEGISISSGMATKGKVA